MRVIIAGSRTIEDYEAVSAAIESSGFKITEVVSGACPTGVDQLGEEWAGNQDADIPIRRFPADWKLHGNSAGVKRNGVMALYADALILVWDGQSPGSADMLRRAKQRKLKIHEVIV